MLHYFLYQTSDGTGLFNLFKYLTFRTGGATLTALVLCFLTGPAFIRWFKSKQVNGQPIRDDGPQGHLLTKKGTPTMGGVMIMFALVTSTLLWADLTNINIWTVLFVCVSYGLLGFMDDYLKVTKQQSKGLTSREKFYAQSIIALIACALIMTKSPSAMGTSLALPFVKDLLINLSWFYVPFVILVIVGASNAVNLTDGLDGLAIVPTMITAASFALICYLVGNSVFSNYLQIHHIAGTGELAILCGALLGAGLGFLWYNAPPAMIFMGDTGSLAIGGTLGTISVITKHELVLAIIGGLFVVETLSVIVQVTSFRLTGKRVFRMAPLHHHFEQKGWAESTIVIRFWIISVILAMVGLSTLKLR